MALLENASFKLSVLGVCAGSVSHLHLHGCVYLTQTGIMYIV